MILEAAGTSLDNVLTVTTHLTKRKDLAAYEEDGRYFPTSKPARTAVEVMLNSPELARRDHHHRVHPGLAGVRGTLAHMGSTG